jgi:ABC-2 type transport system permease protein
MLQRAMQEGVRLWEFSPVELTILLGTAIGYFALGYLFFQHAQVRSHGHPTLKYVE